MDPPRAASDPKTAAPGIQPGAPGLGQPPPHHSPGSSPSLGSPIRLDTAAALPTVQASNNGAITKDLPNHQTRLQTDKAKKAATDPKEPVVNEPGKPKLTGLFGKQAKNRSKSQ